MPNFRIEIFKPLRTIIFTISLVLSIAYGNPALAEQTQRTDTSNNAYTNLGWTVNPSPSFDSYYQEVTIKSFDLAQVPESGWINWFHTTLCWSKGNSFQASGEACMWLGLGLLSPRSNGYLGTFDFTFMEGTAFRKSPSDENLNCRRDSNVQGVGAYTTCSLSVLLQLNTKYIFELNRDASLGINWWKLKITNASTKESVNLGSIESSFVSANSELTTSYNHIGYGGKSVPCQAIPAWDLLISQPKVNGRYLAYRNLQNSSCITAHLSNARSVDSTNYFLMVGGVVPSLRDQSFRFTRAFFADNAMNIELDIGSQIADAPDKVYLSAPKLGISSSSPLLARVNGRVASWSIPFDKSLGGSTVTLEAFGELAGKRFTSSTANYVLPGVKCPAVSDSQASASQPKVLGFTFTGTSQKFVRVNQDTLAPVSNPSNLVGCYVVPEMINFESPDWQIGSISRDSGGFYFVNGAGIRWRLTLIDNGTRLENDPTAPYYYEGRYFNLNLGSSSGSGSSSSSGNSTNSGSNSSPAKPSKPTFSGVNFVGNKLNINVNLGSSSANRPDKIYLVAPKLGFNLSNPLAGAISGSNATWSIELDRLLSGQAIPLEIIGERDGIKSDSLVGTYDVPALLGSAKVTSVPAAPSNFKSRIVGSSALITVETGTKAGSLASNGYLFSKSLGIPKGEAIEGDVVGKKVVLEVPIRASMAGKRFPVTIFLTNEKGESKPLNATLSIPAAPKAPTLPTAFPTPKAPKTVICVRANQTRAFEGTSCPPGWEKR